MNDIRRTEFLQLSQSKSSVLTLFRLVYELRIVYNSYKEAVEQYGPLKQRHIVKSKYQRVFVICNETIVSKTMILRTQTSFILLDSLRYL